MDRKNIIVVEANSTGQFFIEDIIHRGYNPSVLKMYYVDPVLATKLAADLGLTGNPVSILPAMTEKPKMHEAFKKAGLRCIEGATVTSIQEGVDFYVKYGLKKLL